jgi:predicted PurR-regulated permease PerM
MNRDGTTRILFVILLLAVLVSAYRIVEPFLAGVAWAIVLVAAFGPFHSRLQRVFGGRHRVATAGVTMIVAAFVVVPIMVAAVEAVQAAMSGTEWITAHYQSSGVDLGLRGRWPWIADAIERGKHLLGMETIDLKATAFAALERIGSFIAAEGPALVGGALGLVFSFVVMLVAMPLLFTNGESLSGAVAGALPVGDDDARRIMDELTVMTRSVFISLVLTAGAQAALGGMGLFALGVPHVIPLTAVMFFAALVPGGTALVWAPAALWLAATGHPWKAIVMVAWGGGVVSMIDNVLRPILAGKGVTLPRSLLFLGMFGGMIAFGLVGLFIGPIVLYMAREMLAILRRDTTAPPAAT